MQKKREKQSEFLEYNRSLAEAKFRGTQSYKKSGHYHKEGHLMENSAVLADPQDLHQTLRKRAENVLSHQLASHAEKKQDERGLLEK